MKNIHKIIDFITFPFRAVCLIETDFMGLSSLRTERFNYVAQEVSGHCLDIGCGRGNLFIKKHLNGIGIGIDVYPYSGLTNKEIVEDPSHLPFRNGSFSTVTFIANLNHVPKSKRLAELKEAYRCLKPGGKIIVTMGNPIAETAIHKLLYLYDHYLQIHVDVDTERGMSEEEAYFLTDDQITALLTQSGFKNVKKKFFSTQWYLNHLFVAIKPNKSGRRK